MSDHTPTFAGLCSAIADGTMGATFDGETYQLSVYELRRYFDNSRSLPHLLSSGLPASLAVNDPGSWSASMRISVV